MHSRLIYVSSAQRIMTLCDRYDLTRGSIREGDYLFKLDELQKKDIEEIEKIARANRPFVKVIFKSEKNCIIKLIPEQELLDALAGYRSERDEVSGFIKKVTAYFAHNPKPVWRLGKRCIDFNRSPLIMGILNVTPDSFSDGGRFFDRNKAVDHALEMIEQGADIIDIGGESTRPGAQKVTVDEELHRVLPVIEAIRKESDVLISIDSYKSAVAAAALQGGADIINDISGLTFNNAMITVIEKFRCPYILMHIQGTPQTMQQNPDYQDVQDEVYHFFSKKCEVIAKANDGRVVIDPGFGFGKSVTHNLLLLRDLLDFTFIGKPVLVGISRKSFIGKILNMEVDQRFVGTIVTEVYAALKKADILRVHDIRETNQAKKMLNHIFAA